jgi:hypothetical protein
MATDRPDNAPKPYSPPTSAGERIRLDAGLDRAIVAAPVRMPRPSRELLRSRAAAQQKQAVQRMRLEGSQARGLVLLAMVVLLGSIARAGVERVFFTGWWRTW